jgi:hypothetical protein
MSSSDIGPSVRSRTVTQIGSFIVVKTGFAVRSPRSLTARRALLPVAPVALLLVGLALSCTKRLPDQPCAAGEISCFDERMGLFCRDGKLATMTCLGPAGCQKVGKDEVACDNPVARTGDGCNQLDDQACTEDGKSAVACRKYKFVVSEACRGPRGCVAKGDRVACDNALAEPGDLCTTEGETACQTNRAAFLKCTKGTFQVSNGCRGARHCTVTEKADEHDEHFECDDSITEVGDPCEDNGESSCSVDHKTLNVCSAHRIAVSKPCPGPRACSWIGTGSRFDCDTRKK